MSETPSKYGAIDQEGTLKLAQSAVAGIEDSLSRKRELHKQVEALEADIAKRIVFMMEAAIGTIYTRDGGEAKDKAEQLIRIVDEGDYYRINGIRDFFIDPECKIPVFEPLRKQGFCVRRIPWSNFEDVSEQQCELILPKDFGTAEEEASQDEIASVTELPSVDTASVGAAALEQVEQSA